MWSHTGLCRVVYRQVREGKKLTKERREVQNTSFSVFQFQWYSFPVFYRALLSPQDIDYVVCTGDLVPHHIWRISREENVAIMKEMSELLRTFFPTTPIYGSIGNHESFPRDRWDDTLYRKPFVKHFFCNSNLISVQWLAFSKMYLLSTGTSWL